MTDPILYLNLIKIMNIICYLSLMCHQGFIQSLKMGQMLKGVSLLDLSHLIYSKGTIIMYQGKCQTIYLIQNNDMILVIGTFCTKCIFYILCLCHNCRKMSFSMLLIFPVPKIKVKITYLAVLNKAYKYNQTILCFLDLIFFHPIYFLLICYYIILYLILCKSQYSPIAYRPE